MVAAMNVDIALRAARADRRAVSGLCRELVASTIIVLGSVQDDGTTTGEAQLDVLHYLSDGEQVMPVFTESRFVDIAVREDPTCGGLTAITVQGTYLLEKVSDAVLILVNPWSDLEVELPSTQVRAAIRSTSAEGS